MVCFADHSDDEYARKLSWMGINKDTYARTHGNGSYKWMYEVESVGFKYHGNSIMAAIGLAQLRYLDRDNAYRRQLSRWYDAALGASERIGQIPITTGCESSRHLYPVLVDNRNEVVLALNNAGIAPGVHYRINTEYPMYSYGAGMCPNAEKASRRLLSLPMHLGLGFDEVNYVGETLVSITERHSVHA
jgi:dTDP-4-amino-4,6-dideoxygalactose transaminase